MSQAYDQIFLYLYLSILLSALGLDLVQSVSPLLVPLGHDTIQRFVTSVGLSESCVDEVYLVLWTLVEEVYISLSFVLILWTALSMDFEGFSSRSPISS